MVDLLERHRRLFLLTGIVICILAIIVTINPALGPTTLERGLSYIVAPMQRGANVSISWVQGHFTAMGNTQQLLLENHYLRERLNSLEVEINRLQLAGEENARLSALLEINQRYAQLATIGARVIGTSPNDWHHRFFLDRGTNHGIANNMAVLGDGGLAGVVRRVQPTSSQFVSVIDPDFSAAVMSNRTGDIGEIRNDIRLMQQGLMRMDRIVATAQIIAGDEIVTSTHSSIFEPGIVVGTVVGVYPNPDGHTRHAIIRPAAYLTNLEVVSIILSPPGDSTSTRDGHNFIVEE